MVEPKVLLLYTPLQFLDQEAPRPDGALGPLYLAGALEDAGIEVDVVDAVLGPENYPLERAFNNRVQQANGLIRIGMSWEDIAELVAKGGYNIVGIHSNFTPQTKLVLETARVIKSVNPEILVLTGGVNARSLVKKFLESGFIDLVAMTESEKILPRLARQWTRVRNFDGIEGVMFLKDGQVVNVPPRPDSVITNLDDLPLPRWGKLPQRKYAQVAGPHGDVTLIKNFMYAPIMTSRGCPFKCAYCHISLEKDHPEKFGDVGTYRVKSAERVLREVEILKNLGMQKLYFEDDSMLAKKARVKTIFEHVKGSGLKIANVNGVNLVHFLVRDRSTGKLEPDRDYFQLLKDAGFDNIVFPVESGSQRVLDKYATAKLHLETMDVRKLVKVACDVGIQCPINMMIGFPDETEEEVMSTVRLGKELVDSGALYCSFFIPIPFPGSQLFDYAIANGHLDPDYDTDHFNIHRVAMKNTAVSPERLLEIRRVAWRTANRQDYVQARLRLSISEDKASSNE